MKVNTPFVIGAWCQVSLDVNNCVWTTGPTHVYYADPISNEREIVLDYSIPKTETAWKWNRLSETQVDSV